MDSSTPTPAEIRAHMAAMAPSADHHTDIERIRDALHSIPPDDRDTWVRCAMAVKDELGEAGREVWDAWSQGSDSYRAADARDVWRSVKPGGGVTIASLFEIAKRHGWRPSGDYQPPSAEEQAKREAARREREAAERQKAAEEQARAADLAGRVIEAAGLPDPSHPYLMRKGITDASRMFALDAKAVSRILGYTPKASGERLEGMLLIAPIERVNVGIVSLELIDEAGRKAALRGRGTKSSAWWTPDAAFPRGRHGRIVIAEGVATTLSLSAALDCPCLAALSVSNMKAIAELARERNPAAEILVAADLEKSNAKPHPSAVKAAQASGAILVAPDFGEDRPQGATDWNDLHVARGLDVVKHQIEAQIAQQARASEEPQAVPWPDAEEAQGEPDILAAAVDPAAEDLRRAGEKSPMPTPGERGERGENPATARDERGANRGESRAKRGESGANLSDDEKRAALARAARVLTADASPAAEYPVDALGPLADATRALADGVQIRAAMAGQSLLAVAAMLAQSVANVRTIESVKPLSLYCLTIGESGDGKSSGDAVAQAAVQARQRIEARSYLDQVREAQASAKGRVKGDPPPEELPPEPYRIARDGTVEGIRRSFAQGVPSQGVFSSEAAAMLAGYGMNPDNRAKTAATFNALWDDGELSVSRGTTGRLQLYDRRLSIHWLLQPEAAHEVMADPLLSGIGFWPRFLIAWPEPSAPRVARPWRADQCPQIGDYWRACTRLLDRPLGDDCADLPVLELSDEAMRLACAFFERMEQAAKGRPAPLREVKPYAVRSTEQALRVAGVLSVYAGSREVDAEAVRNGIALAAYSLETWRGVFGDRDIRTARQLALTLYRWLLDQPEACASLTAISRIGPKATRSKDKRDTALAVLEHAGLAENMGYTWGARA